LPRNLVGILTYISVLRFRADTGLVDHTHQVLNALSELVSSVTGAIRLGVRAVLTKPVSRKELLAALHDIFQERRELDKSQSA
jgi:DNA-binding NarL/FixJ family response regulator